MDKGSQENQKSHDKDLSSRLGDMEQWERDFKERRQKLMEKLNSSTAASKEPAKQDADDSCSTAVVSMDIDAPNDTETETTSATDDTSGHLSSIPVVTLTHPTACVLPDEGGSAPQLPHSGSRAQPPVMVVRPSVKQHMSDPSPVVDIDLPTFSQQHPSHPVPTPDSFPSPDVNAVHGYPLAYPGPAFPPVPPGFPPGMGWPPFSGAPPMALRPPPAVVSSSCTGMSLSGPVAMHNSAPAFTNCPATVQQSGGAHAYPFPVPSSQTPGLGGMSVPPPPLPGSSAGSAPFMTMFTPTHQPPGTNSIATGQGQMLHLGSPPPLPPSHTIRPGPSSGRVEATVAPFLPPLPSGPPPSTSSTAAASAIQILDTTPQDSSPLLEDKLSPEDQTSPSSGESKFMGFDPDVVEPAPAPAPTMLRPISNLDPRSRRGRVQPPEMREVQAAGDVTTSESEATMSAGDRSHHVHVQDDSNSTTRDEDAMSPRVSAHQPTTMDGRTNNGASGSQKMNARQPSAVESAQDRQFMVPWQLLFCSLCKRLSTDEDSAKQHLKSAEHYINYNARVSMDENKCLTGGSPRRKSAAAVTAPPSPRVAKASPKVSFAPTPTYIPPEEHSDPSAANPGVAVTSSSSSSMSVRRDVAVSHVEAGDVSSFLSFCSSNVDVPGLSATSRSGPNPNRAPSGPRIVGSGPEVNTQRPSARSALKEARDRRRREHAAGEAGGAKQPSLGGSPPKRDAGGSASGQGDLDGLKALLNKNPDLMLLLKQANEERDPTKQERMFAALRSLLGISQPLTTAPDTPTLTSPQPLSPSTSGAQAPLFKLPPSDSSKGTDYAQSPHSKHHHHHHHRSRRDSSSDAMTSPPSGHRDRDRSHRSSRRHRGEKSTTGQAQDSPGSGGHPGALGFPTPAATIQQLPLPQLRQQQQIEMVGGTAYTQIATLNRQQQQQQQQEQHQQQQRPTVLGPVKWLLIEMTPDVPFVVRKYTPRPLEELIPVGRPPALIPLRAAADFHTNKEIELELCHETRLVNQTLAELSTFWRSAASEAAELAASDPKRSHAWGRSTSAAVSLQRYLLDFPVETLERMLTEWKPQGVTVAVEPCGANETRWRGVMVVAAPVRYETQWTAVVVSISRSLVVRQLIVEVANSTCDPLPGFLQSPDESSTAEAKSDKPSEMTSESQLHHISLNTDSHGDDYSPSSPSPEGKHEGAETPKPHPTKRDANATGGQLPPETPEPKAQIGRLSAEDRQWPYWENATIQAFVSHVDREFEANPLHFLGSVLANFKRCVKTDAFDYIVESQEFDCCPYGGVKSRVTLLFAAPERVGGSEGFVIPRLRHQGRHKIEIVSGWAESVRLATSDVIQRTLPPSVARYYESGGLEFGLLDAEIGPDLAAARQGRPYPTPRELIDHLGRFTESQVTNAGEVVFGEAHLRQFSEHLTAMWVKDDADESAGTFEKTAHDVCARGSSLMRAVQGVRENGLTVNLQSPPTCGEKDTGSTTVDGGGVPFRAELTFGLSFGFSASSLASAGSRLRAIPLVFTTKGETMDEAVRLAIVRAVQPDTKLLIERSVREAREAEADVTEQRPDVGAGDVKVEADSTSAGGSRDQRSYAPSHGEMPPPTIGGSDTGPDENLCDFAAADCPMSPDITDRSIEMSVLKTLDLSFDDVDNRTATTKNAKTAAVNVVNATNTPETPEVPAERKRYKRRRQRSRTDLNTSSHSDELMLDIDESGSEHESGSLSETSSDGERDHDTDERDNEPGRWTRHSDDRRGDMPEDREITRHESRTDAFQSGGGNDGRPNGQRDTGSSEMRQCDTTEYSLQGRRTDVYECDGDEADTYGGSSSRTLNTRNVHREQERYVDADARLGTGHLSTSSNQHRRDRYGEDSSQQSFSGRSERQSNFNDNNSRHDYDTRAPAEKHRDASDQRHSDGEINDDAGNDAEDILNSVESEFLSNTNDGECLFYPTSTRVTDPFGRFDQTPAGDPDTASCHRAAGSHRVAVDADDDVQYLKRVGTRRQRRALAAAELAAAKAHKDGGIAAGGKATVDAASSGDAKTGSASTSGSRLAARALADELDSFANLSTPEPQSKSVERPPSFLGGGTTDCGKRKSRFSSNPVGPPEHPSVWSKGYPVTGFVKFDNPSSQAEAPVERYATVGERSMIGSSALLNASLGQLSPWVDPNLRNDISNVVQSQSQFQPPGAPAFSQPGHQYAFSEQPPTGAPPQIQMYHQQQQQQHHQQLQQQQQHQHQQHLLQQTDYQPSVDAVPPQAQGVDDQLYDPTLVDEYVDDLPGGSQPSHFAPSSHPEWRPSPVPAPQSGDVIDEEDIMLKIRRFQAALRESELGGSDPDSSFQSNPPPEEPLPVGIVNLQPPPKPSRFDRGPQQQVMPTPGAVHPQAGPAASASPSPGLKSVSLKLSKRGGGAKPRLGFGLVRRPAAFEGLGDSDDADSTHSASRIDNGGAGPGTDDRLASIELLKREFLSFVAQQLQRGAERISADAHLVKYARVNRSSFVYTVNMVAASPKVALGLSTSYPVATCCHPKFGRSLGSDGESGEANADAVAGLAPVVYRAILVFRGPGGGSTSSSSSTAAPARRVFLGFGDRACDAISRAVFAVLQNSAADDLISDQQRLKLRTEPYASHDQFAGTNAQSVLKHFHIYVTALLMEATYKARDRSSSSSSRRHQIEPISVLERFQKHLTEDLCEEVRSFSWRLMESSRVYKKRKLSRRKRRHRRRSSSASSDDDGDGDDDDDDDDDKYFIVIKFFRIPAEQWGAEGIGGASSEPECQMFEGKGRSRGLAGCRVILAAFASVIESRRVDTQLFRDGLIGYVDATEPSKTRSKPDKHTDETSSGDETRRRRKDPRSRYRRSTSRDRKRKRDRRRSRSSSGDDSDPKHRRRRRGSRSSSREQKEGAARERTRKTERRDSLDRSKQRDDKKRTDAKRSAESRETSIEIERQSRRKSKERSLSSDDSERRRHKRSEDQSRSSGSQSKRGRTKRCNDIVKLPASAAAPDHREASADGERPSRQKSTEPNSQSRKNSPKSQRSTPSLVGRDELERIRITTKLGESSSRDVSISKAQKKPDSLDKDDRKTTGNTDNDGIRESSMNKSSGTVCDSAKDIPTVRKFAENIGQKSKSGSKNRPDGNSKQSRGTSREGRKDKSLSKERERKRDRKTEAVKRKRAWSGGSTSSSSSSGSDSR